VNQDFIIEQLKTIRNLSDIAIVIRSRKYFRSNNHFHTIVEKLLEEAQDLVDRTCVVRDEGTNGSTA
jgi:hypothetical protein